MLTKTLFEWQLNVNEPASPVPFDLDGLGGIQQDTAEMGKEKLAKFSVLISGCNVNRCKFNNL